VGIRVKRNIQMPKLLFGKKCFTNGRRGHKKISMPALLTLVFNFMTIDEKEKLKNFLWELVITIENTSNLPEDWIKDRANEIRDLFESGQDCA